MPVYLSESHNPFFHLAVEEWLLREQQEESWLFYRNAPCVVVGRFQNPWKESDLGWMQAEGIPLVRRPSGGGTVWHDLGNVNFCHVGPLKGFHRDRALLVVQEKLKALGVDVSINARHDLVVPQTDGTTRKVSGSAYKQTKDRSLHHGTLLLEGDLDKLERALTTQVKLLSTKSIPSVRSKVMNLPLGPSEWLRAWGPMEKVQEGDARFNSAPWKEWTWVYGETPFFEWEFQAGPHHIKLSSHKGLIKELLWPELGQAATDANLPLRFESFDKIARAQGQSLIERDWLSVLGA